jgi:hypothetical protein
MEPIVYHVLKATEGGIGQKFAADTATRLGAKKVVKSSSYYVGHTAIVVTATKRVHTHISNALFR